MPQDLPPHLLALFAPRDPIQYLPPLDKLPHEKKSHNYNGLAHLVKYFEDPNDAPPPVRIETREEKNERKRREKAEQAAYKLEQDIALWNPNNNVNATSDPKKTLFVARLNYDTSESKLRREFEEFGPIRKIVLIHNKLTGKPRGYAFVEYEHERNMQEAYRRLDGKKIDGRRIIVDMERGRTFEEWLPRRLGGGLGGTRRGGPDENIKHSGREDGRVEERDRDRYDRERRRSRSRSRGERRRRRSGSRERRRDRGGERERGEERPRRRRSRSKERERDRGDRAERDRGGDRERDVDVERGDVRERERGDRDRGDRERDRDRGDMEGGMDMERPELEQEQNFGEEERRRDRKRSRSRERERERKRRRSRSRSREKVDREKRRGGDNERGERRHRDRNRDDRERNRDRDRNRVNGDRLDEEVVIKQEPVDPDDLTDSDLVPSQFTAYGKTEYEYNGLEYEEN